MYCLQTAPQYASKPFGSAEFPVVRNFLKSEQEKEVELFNFPSFLITETEITNFPMFKQTESSFQVCRLLVEVSVALTSYTVSNK